MTTVYNYVTQQYGGYHEAVRFASFPQAVRCAASDVHQLVWLHEAEAHGEADARPQEILAPIARVAVYALAAPQWAAAIGTGDSRNPGTHGREAADSMPARVIAAQAALEAMTGAGYCLEWAYAKELIAYEAASALTALWYANRNVRGSTPLGAPAIREILRAVAGQPVAVGAAS